MIDLTHLNTLQVPAKAKDLILLKSPKDLKKLRVDEPYMFLGLGANVLFTKDFPGTIVKIDLKGKKIISENDEEVMVEIAAGENWHDFVTWAVENNWSGVENLALIPGTVGAAAVGNIGAYRQEVKTSILNVQCSIPNTSQAEIFNNSACQFAYRESFFKHHKEYLVTAVQFGLSKNSTPKAAYEETIKIRTEKLPDWTKIPTAGSFFKNPIITNAQCSMLNAQIKDLQTYPTENPDLIKVPAGKLLDELGWKGKKIGSVSTHDKSALVIINLGGASGAEIFDYSEKMRADIKKNFDIDLEYEVLIV
ncbi:MAG: UDP-N-acetylenolpyruvoylglucosamine reductase [Candidatus Amesbacteria bacterium GW2011_GWA2_42_12]|uniref:UDP-N-acetylenolpyruvoylglucosamine reductase n=1 Tax=Candidatus Amesbacteria bacterium GW2011_GWA2_42_12 TaxID=1618356 RepID=A0A0G1AE71_9BACT|nr:MAG: UDP-N-acetylenolpyruvoylglucosamine reductase [Candidatus Amesbacteria bacterium GW2011_GWA2_42_12]